MRELKRRLAILALGSIVLVLGTATHANAEGEWRINGEKLISKESLTGLAATTEEFLFLIPTKNLVIHCFFKTWVGVVLLASGESHGKYRYESCKVLSAGKEVPKCTVDPFEFSFKSLLFLHENALHDKKTYILFEPQSGESFGSIKILGEECALTENNNVKGKYVMECVEPASCEAEVLVHPMAHASTELFPSHQLLFGTSPLTAEGRDITEINGVNIGKAWSAVG